MKKLIPLLLLVLTLFGCTQKPPQETVPPTQPQEVTPIEDDRGCYIPGSQLEEATQGAVRLYDPQLEDLQYLLAMGEDLLAVSGQDTAVLTKLSGDKLRVEAQLELSGRPDPGAIQVTASGITYWDSSAREMVFLDNALQEHQRFFLSDDLIGTPVVSPKWDVIYYFTPTALRAKDLQLGIDRVVKEISYPNQTVNALVQDGSLIHCTVSEEDGTRQQLFVDSLTGQTRVQTDLDLTLQTRDGGFFASAPEGAYTSYFYSLDGQQIRQLTPFCLDSACYYFDTRLLAVGAEGNLFVYDLSSGRSIAAISNTALQPLSRPVSLPEKFYFTVDREGSTLIASWEPSLSPMDDGYDHTHLRNADPLTQAKAKAEELGRTYGITILVGEAAALENRDYILEAETREPMLLNVLTQLEAVLSQYPEDFLVTTASGTASGRMTLCITRSIQGSPLSGRLESFSACQFWQDENAYLAISCGSDVERGFHRKFFHVMDNYILSRSKAYYEWEKLNPKDFAYDYDYALNAQRDGSAYLQPQNRSFIDTLSMSFPQEDRASIWEHAMLPGMQEYFSCLTMQEKLTAICKGIREAYGWKQAPQVFPWEQYLETPLAKSK